MISKRERALKRIEEEKKLIEQNERKISSLDAAIEQEEKEKEKLQSEIDVQQNETKILSAVRRKTTRENRTFSFVLFFSSSKIQIDLIRSKNLSKISSFYSKFLTFEKFRFSSDFFLKKKNFTISKEALKDVKKNDEQFEKSQNELRQTSELCEKEILLLTDRLNEHRDELRRINERIEGLRSKIEVERRNSIVKRSELSRVTL